MQSKDRDGHKGKKGAVQLSANKGYLRAVFSHPVLDVQTGECRTKRFFVSLGIPDTKENQNKALQVVTAIERDIAYGELDLSLQKYKFHHALTTVESSDRSPGMSISELWGRYTNFKAKQIEQSTITRDYGKIAKRIEKFPTKRLDQAVEIEAHLLKAYSPETAKRTMKALSGCCNWAIDRKIITENPFYSMARGLRGGKAKNRTRKAFTRAERDIIIQAFQTNKFCSKYAPVKHSYYVPFIQFLFLTGCRPSEGAALRWKHIKPDRILFNEAFPSDVRIRKATKTHTARMFPINEQLRAVLEVVTPPKKPAPNDPVFPAPQGAEIDTHNLLNKTWKPIVEELVNEGSVREYLPLNNTRHTFTFLMREAGLSPEQISPLIGNTPQVLMSNYSASPDDIDVPIV